MSEVTKPTPQERKKRTAELRKKHQPIFDALGVPDAVFIPKMAHYVKGLEGIHMGFFESELEHGEDVYTEKVSMQLESEDPDRTLFKVAGNPHYDEEYAKSEPTAGGSFRYFVPVEEMEEITMPSKTAKKISIPKDPERDQPMDQMTMRDFYSMIQNKPVSSKDWLNDLISKNQ